MLRSRKFASVGLFVAIILSFMVLRCSDNSKATSWTTEIVDWQDAQVGWYTSIVIDRMDYPHICYYDETNDKIKYASWTGTKWMNETVDASTNANGYTSCALDSNDNPHVSYDDEIGDDLRYAYWNGSAWIVQTVDSAGLLAHDTSIALDSKDRPHITYLDWGNDHLKYAWWNGTAWNITTLDATPGAGSGSSIAIDSNDNVHISYTVNFLLKYAIWNGSGWNFELVETTGFSYSTNLVLDSNDNPHIAYGKDGYISYAKKVGTWTYSMVDPNLGADPSLALDALDNPHISYYIGADPDLMYATNTSGSWNIQTVDSAGMVGQHTSIAVDSIGRPYISYFYNNGPIGDLKFANWTGSVWNVITVDIGSMDVGRFASLALDSNGNPHMSYYVENYGDLRYANKTGGTWNWITLGHGGIYGASLALDSYDKPHISYYLEYTQVLKHIYWDGSAWIDETADAEMGVGHYSSLAFNSNDYPAVSYIDYWGHKLKYANWTGSSWATTIVDNSMTVGGYTSLAIDSKDYAHISYYQYVDGDLMYANWTGTGWNNVTVDSAGDTGKYTSLVLDSFDRPHISYYDVTNGTLKHAWWDGSSWENEIVDSSADVGQYNSMAINNVDALSISYYDATNGDLKYASWVGAWFIEVVDSARDVGAYTSLELDANYDPHIAYFDVFNWEVIYAKGVPGPTPPSAPRNLVAAAGDSQVLLTWEAPLFDGGAPITNYKIYRGTSPGTETYYTTIGNVLNYLDINVVNGITYYYRVSAVNSVSEGPWSNEAYATPTTVPSAPTIQTIIPGNGNATLTWTAPVSDGGSPITNYSIYRGTSSGGETFLIKLGNVLIFTDTGLTNGVTYFYQVSAENALGEGPLSNEECATPQTVPTAPTITTITPGNGEITLAWTAPTSDGGSSITNYSVYRGTSSGGETFLIELGNVLAHTDTGLTNGITYYYQVSAKNLVGAGPLSNEMSATPAAVPSAPTITTIIPGDAEISLTWTAPGSDGGSPITNYRLYRGTSSGSETFLTELGNILTYTDEGLTNGITYYYQVSAKNINGEGSLSNEVQLTPTSTPEPVNEPPTCSISYPSNGDVITGVVTISGTASDPDGSVQKVEIRINDGNWIEVTGTDAWTYVWNTSTVANGQYKISSRSYDGLNYSQEANVTVTVNNAIADGKTAGEQSWWWILIIVVVVIVILVLIWLLLRRKKREPVELSSLPE